jgi:chromosome segregation ATPase
VTAAAADSGLLDGSRLLLGATRGQQTSPKATETLPKRDRELAILQGRYDELRDQLTRIEEALDAERRRSARLEAELDLATGGFGSPHAA